MPELRDNPIEHIEGGPDCWWIKVRMTPEILRAWAESQDADVTLYPEDDGFVTPVFTVRVKAA